MAKKTTTKTDSQAHSEETTIVPTPEIITQTAIVPDGIDDALDQFDVNEHDIFDKALRKDKDIQKPTGAIKDGVAVVENTTVPVNRIGIPFQKLIVKRRVAFMNVGALALSAKTEKGSKEELLVATVKDVLELNKMKFKLKDVAKKSMSELHCAQLWYSDKKAGADGKEELQLKMKVISPSTGDELYPVFDAYGDLIYFGRGYKTKDGDKDVAHIDIYTSEQLYAYSDESGEMILDNTIPHKYGKMPIIYFREFETEWSDVQDTIDRLEEVISNFGDTNDYNGSPILVARGTIKGFSAKGERGKVIEIEGDKAEVKYVTWDQAPESIKLEIETLFNLIYTMTQTPDISSKGMADLGLQAGVAFDRVFMDAQLAAQDKLDGGFGEGLQRMVNFIKSAICNVFDTTLKSVGGLKIEAEVPVFRINEQSEQINNLLGATGGKPLLSQRTAVAQSGLVEDPDAEMILIEEEADSLGKEIIEGV